MTEKNIRLYWRPIETAPKDGRAILLMVEGRRVKIGRWCKYDESLECWRESFDGGLTEVSDVIFNPTMWAPIPKVKEEKAEVEV